VKRSILFGLLVALLSVSAVWAQDDDPELLFLVPEVISVREHDPLAYTQGFLLYDGLLYESTGRYGATTLREVDPESGEVLRSFEVEDTYFGEGLARVDDRLIQITWREGAAFVYDLESFERLGFFPYNGEGWGLCYDGVQLFMSDGSGNLQVRDPETFAQRRTINVTLLDIPVSAINELECVGDYIYANVWKSTRILRIEAATGRVDAVIDASALLPEGQLEALLAADSGAVLNGVAYDEENDVFLLTGKLWPSVFEVRFVEAE
jgi:glutamine cyclotransferase